jgi:hypothetical protein
VATEVEFDKDFKRINKALEYIGSHSIVIGIYGRSLKTSAESLRLYAGGATGEGEENITTLNSIMFYHEYGKGNNPIRPFFRNAVESLTADLDNIGDKLLQKLIDNKSWTGKSFLDALGVISLGYIVKSIAQGNYIPNKPATIKAKSGRNKPLIDTGTAIRSFGYKVVKSNG